MQDRSSVTRSGFTLFEVLLALALFAVAAAMLTQSAVNAITAYEAVKSNSDHEQLYRFALRNVVAIQDREEIEEGGDIELPDGSSANWEVELEETEMVDLFRVQVVIDVDGDNAETRTYEVYLYRPEWSTVEGDREQLLNDRRQNLEDRRDGF